MMRCCAGNIEIEVRNIGKARKAIISTFLAPKNKKYVRINAHKDIRVSSPGLYFRKTLSRLSPSATLTHSPINYSRALASYRSITFALALALRSPPIPTLSHIRYLTAKCQDIDPWKDPELYNCKRK